MTKTNKRVKVVIQPQKKKKSKDKQSVTAIGQALRTLGGLGGSTLGGMLGHASAGANLGTGLGAAISRWLGQGDYNVVSNSIVKSSLRASDSIPAMHKTGQTVTIRHKEYLASIKGSTDFTVQRYFLLQPGDTNTFPWASGIASHFQQYRIKGMVFHYVPTSGYAVSGTNPAIGAVMMQTSYRANENAPISKTEMLNEYWASEASPAESFCHPIECSPKENPFSVHYVRTLVPPQNDTPLMYDLGVTYVATQGMPATGNIVGDLWVTYEIEFTKPLIKSNTIDLIPNGSLQATVGVAPGAPLGTNTVIATGSLQFTANTRTITFPLGIVGEFVVHIDINATTTFSAMDLSGAPTFTNCTSINLGSTGLPYTRTVLTGTGALGRGHYSFAVALNDPSSQASVLLPSGTWTGSALHTNVTITSQ